MLFHRRVLALLLPATLVTLSAVPAQEVDERAEARLKVLAERVEAASGDKEKLRADILAFQRAYAGGPYGPRAAALLVKLPSALDRLDPKTIPALEKFSWQPKELVGVLGEHRGRHGQQCTSVAFSPDGKLIASGGYYYVRLWDAETMRLKTVRFGGGYYVTSVVFSRDGKRLATGNTYGQLYVWEIQPGETVPRQLFHTQVASTSIHQVLFSPSGKTVACACGDNATRLYDVSGKELKEQAVVTGHTKAVMAVAYTPDGKTLATGSQDGLIKLWNATADVPTEKQTLTNPAPVRSLAYNPAGTVLAAGCDDGKVYLYQAGAAKPRTSFGAKDSGHVTCLSFSSTGNTLAASTTDGDVRLWNLTLSPVRERARLEGHQAAVNGVAYSPDNKLIVSGGSDWMVRTWDTTVHPPKERFVPTSHLGYAYAAVFTPDATKLATGSVDGTMRVWDIDRPDPKTRHYLPSGEKAGQVYAVAVSPDSKAVAFGGNFKTIRQYDVSGSNPRPLRAAFTDAGRTDRLRYTPDGRYLLANGHGQKEAVLFEAATGNEVRRFGPHEVYLNCIAVSPDGKQVATGSGTYLYDKMGKIVLDKQNRYVYNDCTIKLWDLETGKELHAIKTHKVPVYSLGYTPDGKRLYSGAYEGTLRRREVADPLNTETGVFQATSSGYSASGIVVSPDNRYVITNGIDARVIVWDQATGKRVWEWAGGESVAKVDLANDGRHLAIALETGVVYLVRLGALAK